VHPAGRPYPCGFADLDSYDEGWAIAREFTREPGYVDPLATAIANYRAASAAFEAMPDDVDFEKTGDALYRPSLAVLEAWDRPARTAGTAFDALALAQEDIEFLSDSGRAMYGAAAMYLLQLAGSRHRHRA
jgi:hypothetical protein